MLDSALNLLRDSLNRFLINQFSLEEDVVVVNRLVDQEGKRPIANSNKVVLCLINIRQQTNSPYYNRPVIDKNRMANVTHPAMYFNVDLLCVSDFDAYDESLNFIGAVLQFMQKHPSLNVVPDEANKINEQNTLRLDLESESYFDTHNLWSSLGAKYQPSIIIKASQITIDSDSVMRRIPVVESVGVNVDE